MYLEYRFNDEKNLELQVFLCKEPSGKPNLYKSINLEENIHQEYGQGKYLYLFEAAGARKQPYVLDLIHADSRDEAEAIVHMQYDKRFQKRTLIANEQLVSLVL